jgi:hypothetical protein
MSAQVRAKMWRAERMGQQRVAPKRMAPRRRGAGLARRLVAVTAKIAVAKTDGEAAIQP